MREVTVTECVKLRLVLRDLCMYQGGAGPSKLLQVVGPEG